MSDILKRAHEILYDRAEEKERQYGPFGLSMEITRQLASLMAKKEFHIRDIYIVTIAMKLARESHAHKEDNLLDAIVYMAQMNEELNAIDIYKNKITEDLNQRIASKTQEFYDDGPNYAKEKEAKKPANSPY